MTTSTDLKVTKAEAWIDVQPPRNPPGSGTLHVVLTVEILEGKESRTMKLQIKHPPGFVNSQLILDLAVGEIDLSLPNPQEVRLEPSIELEHAEVYKSILITLADSDKVLATINEIPVVH